jgi:hypothetical protein
MKKEVPWYRSEGVWGILFLAATAATPHINSLLEEPEFSWRVAIKSLWMVAVGVIVAIHGHFRESGDIMLTTPRGIPGANRGDSNRLARQPQQRDDDYDWTTRQ